MERKPPYDRYGWQSSLATFARSEPRVVRLQLQQFLPDASAEQVRAWDRSIPWLQRECRELEVRDTSAREYTAILEYELPRDSRRPDVVILERGCVAVLELKGAPFPSEWKNHAPVRSSGISSSALRSPSDTSMSQHDPCHSRAFS